MDSIEFRGVMPIPDAAIEVIKAGQERLVENRAAIFVSNGGAAIDQADYVADGNGAFRFYCEDRVDIYYGEAGAPVWVDVLIREGVPDPLSANLKACPEIGPAVIDATAGGVVDIDFLAGPVQLIEVDTVDVDYTFSNFPAVGKAGSVTVDIKFLGASLPGFTWPQLVIGLLDPDLSKATPLIGRGLVEVFRSLDGEYWALRSGVA